MGSLKNFKSRETSTSEKKPQHSSPFSLHCQIFCKSVLDAQIFLQTYVWAFYCTKMCEKSKSTTFSYYKMSMLSFILVLFSSNRLIGFGFKGVSGSTLKSFYGYGGNTLVKEYPCWS